MEEVEAAAPQLLRTGAGALGWWRLRSGVLPDAPALNALREAYQFHLLRSALRERHLRLVAERLQEVGVEPLFVKGWSMARRYAEPGLRPSGDVDCWVPKEQLAASFAAVASLEAEGYTTDFSEGDAPEYLGRSLAELHSRSQLLTLDGVPLRVLSVEDEFRLACLHFWKHFAWRPLWLCDVAACLEADGMRMDWDYCLHGDSRSRDWIAAAALLSHHLLDARLDGTPFAHWPQTLPDWLPAAVVDQWLLDPAEWTEAWSLSFRSFATAHWKQPRRVLRELGKRFREPIRATLEQGSPFDPGPRLPVQVAATVAAARRKSGGHRGK